MLFEFHRNASIQKIGTARLQLMKMRCRATENARKAKEFLRNVSLKTRRCAAQINENALSRHPKRAKNIRISTKCVIRQNHPCAPQINENALSCHPKRAKSTRISTESVIQKNRRCAAHINENALSRHPKRAKTFEFPGNVSIKKIGAARLKLMKMRCRATQHGVTPKG